MYICSYILRLTASAGANHSRLLPQPPSSRPSTTWASRWWSRVAPASRLGPTWSSWFTLWTAAAAQTRSERPRGLPAPPLSHPAYPYPPLPHPLLHHSHQLRRVFFFFPFLSKPVFLKACVGGSDSPDSQEVDSLCTRLSRESSAASLVLWCHRRDFCAISEWSGVARWKSAYLSSDSFNFLSFF